MESIIADLDNGACPIADRWEDGNGNTCTLNGWGECLGNWRRWTLWPLLKGTRLIQVSIFARSSGCVSQESYMLKMYTVYGWYA